MLFIKHKKTRDISLARTPLRISLWGIKYKSKDTFCQCRSERAISRFEPAREEEKRQKPVVKPDRQPNKRESAKKRKILKKMLAKFAPTIIINSES
jgi:hypothetical protein